MSKGGGRSADGRSSTYRDAEARWHGYVSMGLDADDGTPVRRHVRGRTRSEVTAKVARRRVGDEAAASTHRGVNGLRNRHLNRASGVYRFLR